MPHSIYCIIDPRDNTPFYVGRTANFTKRKDEHLHTGHGSSGILINKLKKNGLFPSFVILEKCSTQSKARRAETFWIETFLTRNIELLNNENPDLSIPSNAGMPWSDDDDSRLLTMLKKGYTTKELCVTFERTRGAIQSRIRHLSR